MTTTEGDQERGGPRRRVAVLTMEAPVVETAASGAAAAALHLIALARRWSVAEAGRPAAPHDVIRLAGALDGQGRA